ncbi:hypothetical protein N7523_005752 [Penicillium sp. IBT 18751x]|nr:hypothetical protein N7523_005656 [Penicillium sp. IBT 18751x]KAJ6118001.1 hypothetical protein N7523_005752 [Penicillium sp. IBT 18751x]
MAKNWEFLRKNANDFSMINGYENLSTSEQEMIRDALIQGLLASGENNEDSHNDTTAKGKV